MFFFLLFILFVNKVFIGFKERFVFKRKSWMCGEDWKLGLLWIILLKKYILFEGSDGKMTYYLKLKIG